MLGINIEHDRACGTIAIDQAHYIKTILKRFGMDECNPVSTPMDNNQKLSKEMCPDNDEKRDEMKDVPYQEAIGSLMYAGQLTRPDICFAISSLSRYNKNPGKAHWNAVKRVFRYLKGTINAKLVFGTTGKTEIIGFCDADWANDTDDRRSTTGYTFLLNGGAISWNSNKQPTVALSTTEAEYMSMSSATQEAIWLKSLNDELFPSGGIEINCDNKSAICLATNNMYSKRSKHIDIKFHFIREKVANKSIKLNYVPTNSMVADVLTKSVTPDKFKKLTIKFGLNF